MGPSDDQLKYTKETVRKLEDEGRKKIKVNWGERSCQENAKQVQNKSGLKNHP